VEAPERARHRVGIGRRTEGDGGNHHRLGPAITNLARGWSSAWCAGRVTTMRRPKSGKAIVPSHLPAEAADLSDDHDRGVGHCSLRAARSATSATVASSTRCRGQVPHCTNDRGRLRIATVGDERRDVISASRFMPMITQRVWVAVASLDQSWAVRSLPGLSVPVMNANARRKVAVGERDARVRGGARRRGHARNDLEGNVRTGERLGFFGSPRETEVDLRLSTARRRDPLGKMDELGV